MKRKILLFIITLVLFFGFGCITVRAKTLCEYKNSRTGAEYQLEISDGNVVAKIYGTEVNTKVGFKIYGGCPSKIYISSAMTEIYEKQDASNSYYELKLVSDSRKVNCGNVTGIHKKIPELTSYIITIIQIAIPVILVIMGSIDLFKGITAAKEDEIKKGQQMFIKRLVIAAIIFFIVIIVKFLISLVADADNTDNMVDCIECFINNDCN